MKQELHNGNIERMEVLQEAGKLGHPYQLKNDPVYIYGGEGDTIVFPEYQEQQKMYYEHYKANVRYHIDPNFKHWFNDITLPK